MNDVTSQPTSLYRYFDRNNALIYVGITSRGITRNREHNADKEWWPYVVRQEVEHFEDRESALKAEKALIILRRPPFNKQHNPDRGELAQAYHAFARAQAEGKGPGHLMQTLKGALPLDVALWEPTKNLLRLRSRPEHIRLSSRIEEPDGLFAQSGGRRANCIGFSRDVYSIELVLQGSWLGEVASASAAIVNRRGIFSIRKVDFEIPHS